MAAHSVVLNIAGTRVALAIADAAMLANVRKRYAEFIVVEGQSPITVQVKVSPGARFIEPQPGPWVIETARHGNRLNYRSYFDAGWLDLARGVGRLEIAPDTEVENFLRVLYAHLCLRDGGLLVHAAGILRGNQGYVFFGPSGSGKTTITTLALEQGYTALSDDLVIIKKQGEAYCVYGAPFRGEMPAAPRTNRSARLEGIFCLAKDTQHHIVNLPAPVSVARLAAAAPFVMEEPAQAHQVIRFCADLMAHKPIRELHFRRDAGFWSQV